MERWIKDILPLVLALMVVPMFTGCTDINPFSSDEDKLVGTWKAEGKMVESDWGGWIKDYQKMGLPEVLVFFSDGTFTSGEYLALEGTYEIKDGKLVLEFVSAGDIINMVYDYYFSDNNTRLHLISLDGEVSCTYIKQS